MRGVEPVLFEKKEIACVYRASIAVDTIQFLTLPDNPFQIGIHDRKKPITLPPHIHNCPKAIIVSEIQEVLYVVKGKIRVTMMSENQKIISRKLLSAGDAILLKSQAHSVEFLGNCRVFEIKQGPYLGDKHAKHYLT